MNSSLRWMGGVLCFLCAGGALGGDSLDVHTAVETALAWHPVQQAAQARVAEAEGDRRANLALPSPSLSFEREGIPRGRGIDAFEEQRIRVSQEFDFPLRYRWRIPREQARVERAKQEAHQLSIKFESEVRLDFLASWVAEERASILERYAASVDSQKATLQRMLELGRASSLDVKRAESEAIEATQQARLARARAGAARQALAKLMGGSPGSKPLVAPLQVNGHVAALPDSASLLSSNPELAILSSSVALRSMDHALAATAWLPTLEIAGFRQTLPAQSDPGFWGGEVSLSLPLWYWWGGVGESQSAKARADRASADMERRRIELANQVTLALEERFAAEETYRAFRDRLLPASRDVARLARRSYDLGEADFLDLLQAQRSLLQRELAYVDAAETLYRRMVEIDRLAGRSIVAPAGATDR